MRLKCVHFKLILDPQPIAIRSTQLCLFLMFFANICQEVCVLYKEDEGGFSVHLHAAQLSFKAVKA